MTECRLTEQYPSDLPSRTFRAILLSGLRVSLPRPRDVAVRNNAARRVFRRTMLGGLVQ
jgi:hypothetical protein